MAKEIKVNDNEDFVEVSTSKKCQIVYLHIGNCENRLPSYCTCLDVMEAKWVIDMLGAAINELEGRKHEDI